MSNPAKPVQPRRRHDRPTTPRRGRCSCSCRPSGAARSCSSRPHSGTGCLRSRWSACAPSSGRSSWAWSCWPGASACPAAARSGYASPSLAWSTSWCPSRSSRGASSTSPPASRRSSTPWCRSSRSCWPRSSCTTRPSRRRDWAACVIGFSGVVLLAMPKLSAADADEEALLALLGMLAVAAATLFYAIAGVFTRRQLNRRAIVRAADGSLRPPTPLETALGSSLVAGFVATTLAVVLERPSEGLLAVPASGAGWLAVLWLGRPGDRPRLPAPLPDPGALGADEGIAGDVRHPARGR